MLINVDQPLTLIKVKGQSQMLLNVNQLLLTNDHR